MTSIFKKKNREVVGQYVDQLVSHLTGLTPDDENFQIAQSFIWSKFENNSFPDTNENMVERQFIATTEKLVYHSQDDRANRLHYLVKEFRKRQTFKQVGISDTHMCLLQLLMCLSVNPTGASGHQDLEAQENFSQNLQLRDYGIGGVNDDLPSTKLYPDKKEIERLNQEKFENDLKDLQSCEEMKQIKLIKRQWERELQAEEDDDSSYYEEEDSEDDVRDDAAKENQMINKDGIVGRGVDHQMDDQTSRKKEMQKKPVKLFKDQQTLFGGLPANDEFKIPIIKSLNSLKFKRRTRSTRMGQIKQFSLNQFLDQYLEEQEISPNKQDQNQQIKDQDDIQPNINSQLQIMKDQHDLKNLLNIRTFDELQSTLSDRLAIVKKDKESNPLLVDNGASQLHPKRSCMQEPLNLNRDLQKALNPYSMTDQSSALLTTERQLVLDVLSMLSQPSLQSETFARDGRQLGVLFKLRHEGEGFNQSMSLSHLSQGTLKNILKKFLQMGNVLQKTCFLFRGIQTSSERLSTVIQALIFAFNNILDRFNSEISDLIQIVLLQAGQISKSQLVLSPINLSRVSFNSKQYSEAPLTLMNLEHILDQQGLFSKITTLNDIMEKGILDYVAHSHSIESQRESDRHQILIEQLMKGDQHDQVDLQSFLQLADIFGDQNDEKKKEDDGLAEDQEGQESQEQNEQYQRHSKLNNDVNNTQDLPNARLNFDYIKPADRATYLLNYLQIQIQQDQLLVQNHQMVGDERLNILKECFLTCLKPYLEIMNDWVCKGDNNLSTHDLKNEFFIKTNQRIVITQSDEDENQNIHQQNSRKQWAESYVFRTINITQLLGQAAMAGKAKGAGGGLDNMLDQNNDGDADEEIMNRRAAKDYIEISCPIFLRPLMKQILSVGKSIKIVRYLENNDMYKPKKKSHENDADKDSVQIKDTLDHQGIDYEKLSQQNVKLIQTLISQVQKDIKMLEQQRIQNPINYMNANRSMPNFLIETIAKSYITNQDLKDVQDGKPFSEGDQYQELLEIAPFQWSNQCDKPDLGKDDDAVMEEENEKQDLIEKIKKESNIENMEKQFHGIFKMPKVIKYHNCSEGPNKEYHERIKQQDQDQMEQIASQQRIYDRLNEGIVGQEIEWNDRLLTNRDQGQNSNYSTDDNSPKEAKVDLLFGNNKPAKDLVIGNKCKKIETLEKQKFFDFAQQELSIYRLSMRQYQSSNAFQYYLPESEENSESKQGALSSLLPFQISFRYLTLETYLYDSILLPIQGIFQSTSYQFVNKYLMSSTPQYCQLQDQLLLLHKVYFLQGVAIQNFLSGLFDRIDETINHQSSMTNQLYLINGNFQDCLAEMLKGNALKNLNSRVIKANMNVDIDDGGNRGGKRRMNKQFVRSSDFLQSMQIVYNCEWPIEIVIDKLTIVNKYNRIFKLLINIKFAKFIMQKHDYHIREPNLLKTTRHYSYAKKYLKEIEEMGARERLILENKVMLGQLMQQLQVFQGELLHFITTMEDYFMNRATNLECRKLFQELGKIGGHGKFQDPFNLPVTSDQVIESMNNPIQVKDLDDIIELHDKFTGRILQLCLLDPKSEQLLKYIFDIVDICQEFRKLIKSYLLSDDIDLISDDEDSYYNSRQQSFQEDDFDAGQSKRTARSKRIEEKFNGMGLLNFNSGNFVKNCEECSMKLNELRTKYEKHMLVLTTNLNKLTKNQSGKIILSYLLEILQRLNFNSHYVPREDEGLPPG